MTVYSQPKHIVIGLPKSDSILRRRQSTLIALRDTRIQTKGLKTLTSRQPLSTASKKLKTAITTSTLNKIAFPKDVRLSDDVNEIMWWESWPEFSELPQQLHSTRSIAAEHVVHHGFVSLRTIATLPSKLSYQAPEAPITAACALPVVHEQRCMPVSQWSNV